MDRRNSIKALFFTSFSASVLMAMAKDPKTTVALDSDRMQEEKDYLAKIKAGPKFFDLHEMATIKVLADIIMPKDKVSGSASEAKVPEFIAFIVQDMPNHQVPMKGGLRWLDLQCLKRFEKSFVECSASQQLEMVELQAVI